MHPEAVRPSRRSLALGGRREPLLQNQPIRKCQPSPSCRPPAALRDTAETESVGCTGPEQHLRNCIYLPNLLSSFVSPSHHSPLLSLLSIAAHPVWNRTTGHHTR